MISRLLLTMVIVVAPAALSQSSDSGTIELNLDQVRPVTCFGGTFGNVQRDYWTDIQGPLVEDLTEEPGYPDFPDGMEILNIESLEGVVNWGTEFGDRYSGFIRAPVTGSYRFHLSSDDGGEFFLSTDASPDNLVSRATVPEVALPGQFDKYPSQTSPPITLQANERYYFEALHKEQGGDDHLQIAWTPPGESLTIIPGACVSASLEGGVTVDLKVNLQGAWAAGGMNTGQPVDIDQPFAGNPWDYPGTEQRKADLTGIVDWVLIEFRNDTGIVFFRTVGLLKGDGTIVDPNGSGPIFVAGISAGSYFVVVRQRNHLAVISPVLVIVD